MSRDQRWLVDPVVRRQLAAVERQLREVGSRGGRCPGFHRQLLSPHSKRLRPALLLLAARFGNDTPHSVTIAAAAGLETLHEATLYHDDIVDEAMLRRGQPSVHAAFGPVVAALAGSELLYATPELFADLPARQRRSIGRAIDALCRGQLREIEILGDPSVGDRQRLRIMRDKTATLFGLAMRIGAALGGVDEAIVVRIVRFGMRFGMCFQLADDLLDLQGTHEAVGRVPHADLRDGVYTLPVLYALEGSSTVADLLRSYLLQLQGDAKTGLVDGAVALVRQAGGTARGVDTLRSWIASAEADLEQIPGWTDHAAARSLRRLIRSLGHGTANTSGERAGSASPLPAPTPGKQAGKAPALGLV